VLTGHSAADSTWAEPCIASTLASPDFRSLNRLGRHAMTQMDFNPPKKGSGSRGNLKKIVGGGGLAVMVIVSLAIGWLCLEVFRQGRQPAEQTGGSPIAWRTIDEGTAEAKKAGKLILYDFSAAWCGPCKMLDIDVFSDEQVAKLINEQFVPIRVMDRRQEEGMNARGVEAGQE